MAIAPANVRILCALFIFQLLGIAAEAQRVQLIDALSGKAVEGVYICNAEGSAAVVSDAKGQFDTGVFAESDTLQFTHVNYSPKVLSYADILSRTKPLRVNMLPAQQSLEAVTVSALRNPVQSRAKAMRIAAISPELIQRNAPSTSADVLAESGEVQVQKSQQGGGSPMIRGFAANRLLIAVDGVRMNNAIFRAGNLQNVISIDPLSIQSAQVIFGPGSVVYGSDALGGVMAFETLKPIFSAGDSVHTEAMLMGRYSTANTGLMGHVQAKVGTQRWASVSSVSYNDFGDLRMGRHGPSDWQRGFYADRRDGEDIILPNENPNLQVGSAYSQLNLMQKVAFRPNSFLDLQYAFHLSTTSDIPRYDRLIEAVEGQPRHAEWAYGPQEWMLNHFTLHQRKASALYDEFQLSLAHQRFGESRINRRFGDDLRRERSELVNAYSANLDFVRQLGAGRYLDYGIEAVYNTVATDGFVEHIDSGVRGPELPRLPESTWGSYAGFLAFRQMWSGGHQLQAGIRYNLFAMQSSFDTSLIDLPFEKARLLNAAPAASLGYTLSRGKWRYEVLGSTGFRAPNVDDVGKVFDSEPGRVTVPNADLLPEQAWNAEIGLAYRHPNGFSAHFSAYYTYLDGAMVRRNSSLNGLDSIVYEGERSQVQQLQNAAYAEIFGVQARMEWVLPGGWHLQSSFNWQEGSELDAAGVLSAARHAAPWFGLSRLGYTFRGLYLELNAFYSGGFRFDQLAIEERGKAFLYARDAEGRPFSPAWYTINFRSTYHLGPRWRLDFGLENITDQRYRTYSSGIAGAGRNFVLGFSWAL